MQHINTILVPTDYSDSANNALNYAVDLAKLSGSKIILLHVYHPPVPTGEAPVTLITPQELEESNIQHLKVVQDEVAAKLHARDRVESIVRTGFTGEEINEVAKEKNVDLIVMGITGGGKVAQALIGSNAVTTIRKSGVPVLTIPHDSIYRKIKTIVLAYDCKVEMAPHILKNLKSLLRMFNAKLIVVDVVDPEKLPSPENAAAVIKLENSLSEINHELLFPQSDDVAAELNACAEAHQADWLMMLPHKHKFLESLFHKSNTKEVAFHTHIPLLTMHE